MSKKIKLEMYVGGYNIMYNIVFIIHKIRKPGNKRARKNVSGPEFLAFENWELSARLLDTHRTV
jgi:hypothetical protein